MRCPSCDTANPEGMRYCGHCGGALDRVCPRCAAAMPPSFGYCGRCGMRMEESAGRAAEGERRQVTCVFADISGFTSLAERLDPEELHAVMRTAWDALAEEIRRNEGMIEKYIGDAVVAVFGAPLAHEDDPERALAAALGMQAALERVNASIESRAQRRLGLRIGVNTGVAVAGAIGDRESEYGVLGDAVNVAARLQQAADPGEVLVGDATYRLTEASFRLEPHPPVMAKGKTSPLVTWRLVGRATASVTPRTPLVGRADALASLLSAISSVETGRGRFISIVGQPGLGASRLVSDLLADPRSRGMRVARVRCSAYERRRAYAPLGALVRALLAIPQTDPLEEARGILTDMLPGLEPEVRGLLLETLGYPIGSRPLSPGTRRLLVERGVRDVLLRVAETQPVLVAIEQVHWVDSATLAFLESCASALETSRALVIVTALPDFTLPWAGRPNHLLVELEPLTKYEAEQLLRSLFPGTALPDPLVEQVVQCAGGNPAFLEEAARALAEAGVVVEREGRRMIDLSRSVELATSLAALVLQRTERLAADERRVVQYCAVLGSTSELPILRGVVAAEAEVDAVVERLVAAGFLRRAGGEAIRFVHDAARDAIYRSVPARVRGEMHGRVGLALERLRPDVAQQQPELLASHFARSAYSMRAADYALRAGERAASLDDLDDAAAHYASAAELAERLAEGQDERVRALRALAAIEERRDRIAAAVEAYDAAIAAPSSDAAMLQASAGRALAERGDLDAAAVRLAAAQREGSANPAQQVELAIAKAWLGLRGERAGDAFVVAEEAARVARELGDPRAELEADRAMGLAARALARPERRRTCLLRMLELAETLGELDRSAETLLELADLLGDLGRHDEQERHAREAYDRYARLSHASGRSSALRVIGVARFSLGDLDGAERALVEGLGIAEALREPTPARSARTLEWLGEVAAAKGDGPRARSFLERSLEASRAHRRVGHLRASALGALGRIALEEGDLQRAWVSVGDAIAAQRSTGCARCAARLGWVAAGVSLGRGDTPAAERYCSTALEQATREQLVEVVAYTRFALARVAVRRGDLVRAREGLESALAILADHGPRPFLPTVLAESAEVLAALGDTEGARAALGRAHALLLSMGAAPRADRIAARLAGGDDARRVS